MRVKVLEEAGEEEALRGLSLNKEQSRSKMDAVAEKLFGKGGGHDQFMRSMIVWLEIDAPLYWWKQFDKYHFAETQSESTMHTLQKKKASELRWSASTPIESVNHFSIMLEKYRTNLPVLVAALPSGFMQKRVVCTNYAQLDTICKQRKGHKLHEWEIFIFVIKKELGWGSFLGGRT